MAEKFQIQLQGTADTQQWLKAEGTLRSLDSAADDFVNSLKAGVGIDLGGKLVNSLGQLQGLFTGFVKRGFDFNSVMAQSEGGIANVLGKFMQLDAQASKREASKAIASIMEWEPKAAGSLQDLMGGFMSTVGAGQAAGITVAQNVELVGKFANALAALGLDASQLTQELRAIFTGNITPDAMMAKTLEITPEAVRSAKEAGTFYTYLIDKIGTLGNTAAGPAVVMSSLSSAIDKAAGAMSKGLFEELIGGAEELTTVLDDPTIKQSLTDVGVSIAKLVKEGVNLTVWATQNAPVLLQVAEGALRIGAALAAIKLTTILAGLLLKAQRWAMVTTAVTANTAALAQNAAAQVAGAGRGPTGQLLTAAPLVSSAAAGTAGGVAMAGGFAAGFKSALGAALPLITLGLVMKLMSQGGEIMSLLSDWGKQNSLNQQQQGQRQRPTELLRDTIAQADTPQDVAAAQNLGRIMQRDAGAEGNEVLLNQLNAIMGKFDELVGKEVDHTAAAKAAADATAAFNAALAAGKAAAGDTAEQITLATASLDGLVKKVSEATGATLDGSTFESLLSGLEGLDKSTAGEDTIKQIESLIKAAATLRDLRATAASAEQQQQRDAMQAATEQRAAAIEQLELQARAAAAAGRAPLSRDLQAQADQMQQRAELEAQGMSPDTAAGVVTAETANQRTADSERIDHARTVAGLEDDIAAARAVGDQAGAQALQDLLAYVHLEKEYEETLGLPRAEAEERASARIDNERLARERNDVGGSNEFGGSNDVAGVGVPTRNRAARMTDSTGLFGDGSSGIDAFNERQKTPLRNTFQFPALDAFAAAQPAQPGAAAASAQPGGAGADVAGAAKQAAASASKVATESANADAAVFAELTQLRGQLDLLAAQQAQMASQITNGGGRA